MPVQDTDIHPETKENAEELLKQMNTIITQTRDKTESLEKKYDGLDFAVVKKNTEAIAEIAGKIGDIKTKVEGQEAYAEKLKALETQQAILAASSGTQKKEDEDKVPEELDAFRAILRDENKYYDFSRSQKHLGAIAENIVKKEYDYVDENNREKITKDLMVGNNPQGGYLVPTQIGSLIVGRIFESSPIRSIATSITIGSSEIQFPLDDQELDSGWVGETQDRPVTESPGVGQIVIPAHEQYAQPQVTQTMLDDSGINIDAWLSSKIADKLSRTENTAFVAGDGSQKPKGFLGYDAWASAGVYQRNAVEQISSGLASTFDGDSFKLLMASLKEPYQSNAVFGMNRASWGEVTQLKDDNGNYLFNLIDNFKTGDTFVILGKNVILMSDMPDTVADAVSVIYGDFREGYTIADRIGLRLIRDSLTAKPYIKFYTTKRVGGAVSNYEALKIMVINTGE